MTGTAPAPASEVLLTAGDAAAGERLRGREIGGGLDAHLERSATMAAHLDAHAPDWVHRVPTDDRTVPEVADAVVRLSGWGRR